MQRMSYQEIRPLTGKNPLWIEKLKDQVRLDTGSEECVRLAEKAAIMAEVAKAGTEIPKKEQEETMREIHKTPGLERKIATAFVKEFSKRKLEIMEMDAIKKLQEKLEDELLKATV